MSFQIVNVAKPNSVKNSTVFVLLEASDSVVNLRIALDQYSSAISDLQLALIDMVILLSLPGVLQHHIHTDTP